MLKNVQVWWAEEVRNCWICVSMFLSCEQELWWHFEFLLCNVVCLSACHVQQDSMFSFICMCFGSDSLITHSCWAFISRKERRVKSECTDHMLWGTATCIRSQKSYSPLGSEGDPCWFFSRDVRSKILMTVTIKITVLWDVTPRSSVDRYQCSSNTLMPVYQTTCHHIPTDGKLDSLKQSKYS
jgi:lysylphosphatidylglycerol synthetase-like protein (DUF2156 family)